MNDKCPACGKFLPLSPPPAEVAKCHKCQGVHHRECVKIPVGARIASRWLCPGCKPKVPRKDNTETPVKVGEAAENPNVESPNREPIRELADEMRLFRAEFGCMRDEITGLRQELSELHTVLGSFKSRVEAVEARVANLEDILADGAGSGDSALQATIADLRMEINDRDQGMLHNDLEVSGIPEVPNENRLHMVHLIALKLGVELDERDVVSADRVGTRLQPPVEVQGSPAAADVRPRVLVVRLTRRAPRDALLRAARVRRGADTADFGLPCAPRRFYVNERLTKTNRALFYKVRLESKRLSWRNPWTREGRVYVRAHQDGPAIRVRSEQDFHRVFGKALV